jgi:hypothetical protein
MAVEYVPHKHQIAIHRSPHRFRVVVWHRRAGKSTLAVNELLRYAKEKPGRYWAILPTYRQAKTVLWPLLLAYTPEDWIRKANESSLELKLLNGSEVALKGAENKDSLRGVGLHGVVMDEYGLMQKDVWTEIILPTLSDNNGWALFIGTPYGKNHFHTLYQYGQETQAHPDWKSWHLSALHSGILSQEELDRIRIESPEHVWEQEWEAKFLEGRGTVFRRIKENSTAKEEAPQPSRLYRMGVDLARVYNWTVLSVIDRHTFEQVYIERFQQLDWNLQKAKIEATALRYNNAEVIIDSTGVGDSVAEELQRKGLNLWMGDSGYPGFKYTSEKKKKLIENLAKLLEQDKIKLIAEPNQLAELEAFTFSLSENEKNPRYVYHAPEGLTDDTVNALALSVWDIGEKLPLPNPEEEFQQTYYENPYG